jgi:hypothetical protein
MAAGRFANPARLLSFLGTIASSGLAREAACRRGPDDSWWAEVEVPWQQAVDLVWAAGGLPFARVNDRWVAVPVIGDLPQSAQTGEIVDVRGWAKVELADLVVEIPLRSRKPIPPTSALHVLVPGTLGRWVLHRALALDIAVGLVPSWRRPLRGGGDETGVLLLRLRAKRGNIPASLVQSLSNLPYTAVCQPTGLEGERLLVDVRYHAPLVGTLLSGMIPEGETWVLGAPDVGHWRLLQTGQEVDGESLVEVPDVATAPAPPLGPVKLPEPIPVSLVHRPGGGERIDAVLLDEAELDWVRPFLAGRPVSEVAFLLPGPGVYLLTAPGGLPALVPFGIPLVRIGPGGLYLELGLDFFPPLPEGARAQAFGLEEGKIVVVAGSGVAYRFDLEQMVPAWTLWVGPAPEVKGGLDKRGQKILSALSGDLRAAQADPAQPKPKPSLFDRVKRPGVDRSQILKQAMQAEARDDLVKAAELLESAGELGAAGRLYERAAARLPH